MANTDNNIYVFAGMDDRDRLRMQHSIYMKDVVEALRKMVDSPAFQARLEIAKNSAQKLKVLDVGCGSGLFLHSGIEAVCQFKIKRNLVVGQYQIKVISAEVR